MLTYNEIQSLLKQKAPFILVDKVIAYEPGKRIIALKNVSGSELFSAFHFPGNPVYPGIFIIESVAQTTSILCSRTEEQSDEQVQFLALGGIQRFQFHKPVRPGDVMRIEVDLIKFYQGMAIAKAVVKVEEALVAEGQLSFGAVKNDKQE